MHQVFMPVTLDPPSDLTKTYKETHLVIHQLINSV